VPNEEEIPCNKPLARNMDCIKILGARNFLFEVSEILGLEERLNLQISTAMQKIWESFYKGI
jgi:hypothetical protein